MNIEVHIEELVLRGMPPGDRYCIGAAVERELARLFAEQGGMPTLAHGSAVAQLDGGAFHVTPGSPAEAIGVQVAQSIYGGVTK